MQHPATSAFNASVGSILFLPPKLEIASEHHYATNAIDDGFFNHPVLILATNSAGTEVVVLGVS